MELVLDFMFPIPGVKEMFQTLIGKNDFSYLSHWSLSGVSQECPPTIRCLNLSLQQAVAGKQFFVTGNCDVIHGRWETLLMKVLVVYSVSADSHIEVSYKVSPTTMIERLPSLPRVGASMQLIPYLFEVSYFGRGPEENYPDRKSGSEMGVYVTSPTKMGYLKYIVPGENGSRSDCEWIAFRPQSPGAGMMVVADKNTFSCGALLHSASDLDKAQHTCDLSSVNDGEAPIHVSIDHKIMGVAGDVSWYPCVYPDFLVASTKNYEYSFQLCPLGENDDAAIIARNITQ